MKIVHLSDTHIVDSSRSLYGIDPSLRLEKAIESINLLHKYIDFVVITGDLTHRGEIGAYEKLKKILSKLKIPYYLVIGNHDNLKNLKKVFDEIKSSQYLQYSFSYKNRKFVFLDTTIKNKDKGGMCKERLEWLKKELDKNKGKDTYIFMHHFPLVSGLNWMDENANFTNSKELLNLVENYRNVKHIFCGHLHRNIFARFKEISISSTKSTTFQVAYNPNTKKDILTIEEKPSYAVVDIDKNGFVINNSEFLTEESIFYA